MRKNLEMSQHIKKIKLAIEPLRQEIINHKVYSVIKDLDDLKVFMEYHVYAVWDFMSLLKTLQNSLTCTTVPWFPKPNADIGYLINEIVVGEETDVDLDGVRKSHFELYLDAMKQCGAETSQMKIFVKTMQQTGDFKTAYAAANTPKEARDFVDFSFQIIGSQKNFLQSAIFTFGREDLIPNMFFSIINEIHKNFPNDISVFKYYIERHIEVDGDHHSHLALQMTKILCGDNEAHWLEVENVVIESLRQRIKLWDGVYERLKKIKYAAAI